LAIGYFVGVVVEGHCIGGLEEIGRDMLFKGDFSGEEDGGVEESGAAGVDCYFLWCVIAPSQGKEEREKELPMQSHCGKYLWG
jgi:hypothetical protein